MKLKHIVLFAVCLSIGNVFAQEADQQAVEEAWGHLEKGKSGFQETWVNPNYNATKYQNLYLWEAAFQYRDVGPAQRSRMTMMNTRQQEFGISEDGRKEFEAVVSEIFVAELNKARKFTVVDQIGSNTLIMRAAVIDIVSNVPPDLIGRGDVYLSNIGEATLVLELIDAEDGETVAVVSERQRIQAGTGRIDSFSVPANRATVMSEVKRWARRAASKLRKELEKAIDKG
jgi:hypothetical protein